MNPPPSGAFDATSPFHSSPKTEVVVFPSLLDLRACKDIGKLTVGAPYARPETNGAFTGDISMTMVKAAGATHVLCGHSERRRHHEESDAYVAKQVRSAMENGMTAVLCIGESADEQELKTTEDVLKRELQTVLEECKGLVTATNFIVAYEPIWAIGTGRTAAPKDAQAVHAFVRSLLPDANIRIIYGGSVSGNNAKNFFAQPDIDGALVGGCSLKLDEFKAIVEAA